MRGACFDRRQDAGDREEALSIIETVAEPSADMLCLCGRIYKDLYIESSYQNDRCLENAIQWYKKGAQLEPSDYAMINLATLLVASGKTFESDKDLKRLSKLAVILRFLVWHVKYLNVSKWFMAFCFVGTRFRECSDPSWSSG